MKEKILALLAAKFPGVRKDALAQLAGVLALQAATDEEATGLVEKLTAEKAKQFEVEYRKDVDKEVSDANKTYEGNLKKKYDFVEKKNPNPAPDPAPNPTPDDTPAWAKALIDQNKALTDRLVAIETGKTVETRLQQLQSLFAEKNLPESFTAQKLKDFKRMNFQSEEEFTEYLTEVDTDITAFSQELADKGLTGQTRPIFGQPNKDGVSSAVQSFIQTKTEPGKVMTGKEV